MARARNIKPGFFANDLLGELSALTRLLFAGLWTICDREGRVEDRPKKIRADVLPYDQCDVDEMLHALEKSGFILRYEAGGKRVIQVLTWDKHQNPHIKESASTLPAPDTFIAETKPAPDKHSASTVLAPGKEQPLPERAGLIPDSGFLTTDSLPLIPRKKSASAPTIPEIPEPLMADFLKVRKAKRAPLTETAIEGIRREAEKAGLSLLQAITVCVENSWQGFRADWYAERQAKPAYGGVVTPINKQEALEARNREVARKWAAGE